MACQYADNMHNVARLHKPFGSEYFSLTNIRKTYFVLFVVKTKQNKKKQTYVAVS